MDIIQVLPDAVANQIAAGEVIERPASVIKELVENAIDAEATRIDVVMIDAGRTLIKVVDNGKGMSPTDARRAFEHHATSKIRKADDLFSLHTMGFRGEALATVAAVAQVELRTCQRGESVGTLINIAGSKVSLQEPVSCPEGSSFSVENIFFNIPARRKFLKGNAAENNQTKAALERIALVYPNISFTLTIDNTEIYNLRAGSMLQRIVDIFGHKMQQDLLPISVDTDLCKIEGFVGKPESSRKKGAKQYFFVNDRYMKHPYFHKAVMMSVERMIPAGEQIPYFIYLRVNTEDIDVNVSPTKTDIKFEHEQAIWQIINATVKEGIGKFCEVPSIDFNAEDRPDIPVFQQNKDFSISFLDVVENNDYNPFKKANSPASFSSSPRNAKHTSAVPSNWEAFFDDIAERSDNNKQVEQSLSLDDHISETNPAIEEKAPLHYQYKGTYIMTAVKSGLLVIDQHRAHLRILFDKYFKQLSTHTGVSQKVLFPEIVEFSANETEFLLQIQEELCSLGFEVSDLGGGSFAINAIPAGMENINSVQLLQDIVSSVGISPTEAINSTIAERLADHAAITYGEILSNEEMESIVNSLFSSTNANYTPSGKKISHIIEDINSFF